MQWFGKAIGAALGMAIGNYPGAVLGALLGHQFDQGLGERLPGAAPRAQQVFFEVTFGVMGRLAKIDSRVSESEIHAARRIMHAMELEPDQVQQAIRHFDAGKDPSYPLNRRLDELVSRIGARTQLARAFVEIQLQAAIGAGEIPAGKRELLSTVARRFGIDRAELARIESLLRTGGPGFMRHPDKLALGDAFETLGVHKTATDGEIKIAYRRLMNEHHPDKLVAKGLPASMTSVAEQRTQQIRAAYDRIKADRGFK